MRRSEKIWLIAAALLIVIGVITLIGVFAACDWELGRLGTVPYETNTDEISEAFGGISVTTDTADVILAASDDGVCRVVCTEEANAKHSAAVLSGTLTVAVSDERNWYDHIGILTGTPTITVYLPESEYASLNIKGSTCDVEIPAGFSFESIDISTRTGDIRVRDISADTAELYVSTGDVTVYGGKCVNFTSDGSTGDILLKDVTVSKRLFIVRSTGDVTLDGCDGGEISVETDTGDVSGILLSEKVFVTETSTGDVSVPNTSSGGKCSIVTSTGDIGISIRQ